MYITFIRGCKHFLELSICSVVMLHTLTVIFLKEQSCFTLLNFCLSHLQQNSVQARQITALLSVSSSLRPSVTIGNIFHWCLVRSQPFTGTGRFLAGLFTFLRRQPIVNQLRVGGRNWFRTVNYEKNRSEFSA